jgi:hypothetical protein
MAECTANPLALLIGQNIVEKRVKLLIEVLIMITNNL